MTTPKPFRKSATREGMRAINLWIPEALHRQLALARVEDNTSMNEMVREALKLWLAQRRAARMGGAALRERKGRKQ